MLCNAITRSAPLRSCVGVVGSIFPPKSQHVLCGQLAQQGQGRDALAPQRIDSNSAAWLVGERKWMEWQLLPPVVG